MPEKRGAVGAPFFSYRLRRAYFFFSVWPAAIRETAEAPPIIVAYFFFAGALAAAFASIFVATCL